MPDLTPVRGSTWWAGVKLVARWPLATLGAWRIIGVVGIALAAALGLLRAHVPALGIGTIVLGFLLTQAAALILAWSRAARLYALMALQTGVRSGDTTFWNFT